MRGRGRGNGRGRGRGSGTSDVDFIPYSFKTERKRGRPRKTPQKMVNETDDEVYFPKMTERNRDRLRKTPPKMVNETDAEAYFPKELSTNGPDQPVQDSGPTIMHPVHTNVLTYSVRGKMENPSNPTTTGAARSDPLETEGALTKDKNNISNPSGDISSGASSESESESSMFRSMSSEYFPQPVPMHSCENHEEINVTANDAAINCQSFNLTDVAVKIHTILGDEEEHDDDNEIKSSPIDPSLIEVKGYFVKPNVGPLLNRILEHHGDIAKECNVRALRGCLLEKVCSVYEKLKYSSFEEIKKGEFKEMVLILDELESMGMNVKWLKKRLDDIIDVKDFLNIYGMKSKQIKKGNDNLITLENTSGSIRQNIAVLEGEILKMKGDEEKVEKARILVNNSLVNGLI